MLGLFLGLKTHSLELSIESRLHVKSFVSSRYLRLGARARLIRCMRARKRTVRAGKKGKNAKGQKR
jgi:hypothetical protein